MRAVLEASVSADIVVGAGDFGDRGAGADEALGVLDALECPLLIVSGNHDRLPLLHDYSENRSNVHVLHGSSITVDGVRFLGIGSAIAHAEPSPNSEWLHEDDATELLRKHQDIDVLISHTPPKGSADAHPDGESGGSLAILQTVQRLAPQLCLCGHVHWSHGVRQNIGRTLVHNIGPQPVWHCVERH